MSKELMNTTEMKEVISKRTACMKVFEHADHRFTAAIYGTPVHYMKDGHWEEIDNRLEAAADEVPADADDMENISGAFRVRLSNKVKKKQMVSLGEGSRKLTWGFVDANSVKRQILKETKEQQPDSAGALEHTADSEKDPTAAYAVRHLKSRILYPEAFQGVDIRYTIGPESLKEDLVLKQSDAVHAFTWRYAPGGLKARQEGADIVFEDAGGREAYRLSAPYMTDAAGEVSHGLTLTLTDDGGEKNKEAYVRLEADAGWLAAEERVYPVVIDPVVTTDVARDKIQDCHVSSFYNTDNFYNSHILKTGRVDGSVLRSYLKFTLPQLNKASEMVTSAWYVAIRRPGGSDQRRIDIHRVTKDWNSRTVTWDNKPSYDPKVADYIAFSGPSLTRLVFDITGVVKDWYADGKNYGLMMKEHGEEEGTYNEYISSDDNLDDNAATRPQIMIQYVSCEGLEDFWTYHQHDIGRAGTGYVNDYNGSQILVHPTYALSGSRAPISLSHVFNSSEQGADIGYGKGFRLNYHQTMTAKKIGSTDYYCQTDGDGTRRYFAKDTTDSKWKDELDQTRILTLDSSNRYTVTDKDGGKQHFLNGLLVKEEDASGNTLSILHNASKIVKLTDGSGREVNLAYGSDGHLSKLTDAAGRVTTFGYTNGFLTSITDPDGAVSRFTYDTAAGKGMMLTAADPYGYKVQYSYGSRAPYRVSKVTEYAGSTEGQSLTLAYGHNRTSFTDSKGRKEVYLFDNAGRTVSVRNDAGYGAAWQYLDTAKNKNKLSAATDLRYVSPQYLRGVTGGMAGWTRYSNADHVVVEDSAAGEAYIGTKCIRIRSTAASGDGAAYQNLTVKAGKRYVFSAYVKASVSELAAKGRIWLQIEDTAKNLAVVADSVGITAGTEGFKRLSVAFTAPDNGTGNGTSSLRILARTRNFKGTAWFDGLQMEEGEAAGRLNLVSNNCFQNGMTDHTALQFAGGDGVLKTGAAAQVPTVLKGTVNEDKVNIRAAAGTAYPALVMAPKGTSATIHGADYDSDGAIWYAIRAKIGNKTYDGYMKGTYLNLSISGAVVTVRGMVAADNLNLRAGAGTGYSAKTMMAAGTAVGIKGAAKDSSGTKWYRLAFTKNGTQYDGYASADYVAVMRPSTSHAAPSGTLNVRTEPNTSCSVAVQIGSSDKVNIVSHAGLKNGDLWYGVKLTKGGKAYTGYVLSDLVTVSSTDVPAEIRMGQQEKVPGGNGPTGDSVLKITGDEKNNKRCYQPLAISGKKGDCFMACGWGYADSVSLKDKFFESDPHAGNSLNSRKNRHFGLHINFISSDANDRNDIHYAEFGADCSEWQFMNTAFVAKHDYVRVDIGFCYGNNSNNAYFTGLGLYKEEYGTSFAYDDKGNVVKVTDQAKKNSSFEYDAAGNIAKLIDIKGNHFEYTHDDKHRLTGAKSAMNMKYAFVYNSQGGISSAKVVDPSNAAKAITATAEYTKDGSYISKLCDEDGNSTSYGWDTAKGWMTSVTDGEGNRTDYTYDACNRVTKVTSPADINDKEQKISVAYTYKNDRMTQIEHNGFVYELLYDGFGKETAVKIAGTQAVSHTYDSKNGLLRSTSYANGFSIRYEYDTLDRLQKMEALKDGSVIYTCRLIYDKHGQICRRELEGDKSCIWTYEYDLLGRMGKVVSNTGEERLYHYDANGNVDSVTTLCDGNKQTIVYTFDKDDRETKLQAGSAVVSRTYDAYGRRYISDRSSGAFKTTYRYAVNAAGQPVNRMEAVENNGKKIQYTYDNNGNIRTIQDEVGVTTYHYDALQRLIREDNVRLNKTIIYTRDAGGNVTQKKVYALSTQENPEGHPEQTIVYAYADGWKDQMTAVDGQAVAYDTAGNVTTYKGRKYSWCGNGILTDVIKEDGTQIHYAVNAEGVRMEKKVNGAVAATYFTDGSQILGEKNASGYQSYIYNSGGEIEAIYYKKSVYYYIKNGQQDIIGLCDASGQWVVDYSYDTWGNLLKAGGSMASTLGVDNPFRYRGYYYDTETGLYYLESRYYNPELGRMMSADSLSVLGMSKTTLNDKNLYNYCDGNPVGRVDESGNFWAGAIFGGVIGGVAGLMTAGAVAEIEGRKVTAKELVVSGLTGLISGAFAGAMPGLGAIFEWTSGQIFQYTWLGNIAIAGIAAGLSTDGSVKNKVDAALNDMVKAAVTGLAFAPPVPVLESNGNTILGAAVGGIYDMSIAKANSGRKNNTSRTSASSSSKSGYSGRWLVSVEWKYTGSGKFCWEICTKRYSDGSISVERWKYAT